MTQTDTRGTRVDSRYVRKLNSTFSDSWLLVSLPINNERSTRERRKRGERKTRTDERATTEEEERQRESGEKAKEEGRRRKEIVSRGDTAVIDPT